MKKYGLLGFCYLVVCLVYTRLAFRGAKIIRLPFDIRNRRNIRIGKRFITGRGCRLEAYPAESRQSNILISIGDDVQINDYVHISSRNSVKIGNNVLIAGKVFISDLNHGSYGFNGVHDHPDIPPADRVEVSSFVEIEDNVWIGESVNILPGVRIGKGSVVGAMSVVTKDIPPYSIAAGCPAKVIKAFDFSLHQWIKV
jgi:acetyltransferase-like isoleucine patch superfamily enzyme